MCHCQDVLGWRWCLRTNAKQMIPHTLPLDEDIDDPTMPQNRPNAEDHFAYCDRDCDGYHQHLKVSPPPGQTRTEFSELCKVIDGLYISNICTAQAIITAREPCDVRFTHILSVYSGESRYTEALTPSVDSRIIVKTIYIHDKPQYALIEHFPGICLFLHEALQDKPDNVLVHCRAGKSRSVSAIIAYLIWARRMTWFNALGVLYNARSLINPQFTEQLRLWEGLRCRLIDEDGKRSAEYARFVREKGLVRMGGCPEPDLNALRDTPRP